MTYFFASAFVGMIFGYLIGRFLHKKKLATKSDMINLIKKHEQQRNIEKSGTQAANVTDSQTQGGWWSKY